MGLAQRTGVSVSCPAGALPLVLHRSWYEWADPCSCTGLGFVPWSGGLAMCAPIDPQWRRGRAAMHSRLWRVRCHDLPSPCLVPVAVFLPPGSFFGSSPHDRGRLRLRRAGLRGISTPVVFHLHPNEIAAWGVTVRGQYTYRLLPVGIVPPFPVPRTPRPVSAIARPGKFDGEWAGLPLLIFGR